ncbi:MAG: DNA mismatch repair protein MutS, partial [Tsuneonella troitsensis]
MMAQYLALKAQADGCLLFYRMGDFFELFFDDARIAAQVLDIALTSRGEHDGAPIPMCGVPVHSAESYLARLIRSGQRVAIAEQVETPDEAKARARREGTPSSKALVARDIVRFVTAGTLTEESLLEPRRANVLAAVCDVRGTCGIAAVDVSTGRMTLEECAPEDIAAVIARLSPSETVAPEGWDQAPDQVMPRPRQDFSSDGGVERLCKVHGVATLDGFGVFGRAMTAAAG